jgi:LemA protein
MVLKKLGRMGNAHRSLPDNNERRMVGIAEGSQTQTSAFGGPHPTAQASSLLVLVLGVVVILVLLGLGIGGIYIGGYNHVVRLDQAASEAWANVDAQLQRRLDLIPNLVATVQGYATHEKEIFENIAQARTKYFQADNVAGKIQASNELSGLLSRLLVLREQYPQLQANRNFLALQDELAGTENRIGVARTRYNQAVKELNTYIKGFPGSIFAKRADLPPRPYFEATEGARTAPPKVDFTPKQTQPPAPAPQPRP